MKNIRIFYLKIFIFWWGKFSVYLYRHVFVMILCLAVLITSLCHTFDLSCIAPGITKTCLFKYIEHFTSKKLNFFQIKNSDIFHISAQNIDCGCSLEPPRRGGSYEYQHSMFLSRNKKNNIYPCKPQFYYIKVGFKGVKIIQACFRDGRGSKR